ncbi:MAG: hypothetical protein IPJ74_09145 [Saprospiraceae bacterium]|nr:hypothetical protein [Saprospiraceae bacterium]
MHFIRTNFPGDIYEIKNARQTFEDIYAGKLKNKLLLFCRNMHDWHFSKKEYKEILEISEFGLVPPGFVNPIGYQIMESLSANAVPVLQHGKLFNSRIVPFCVNFQDKEELLKIMNAILKDEIHAADFNLEEGLEIISMKKFLNQDMSLCYMADEYENIKGL